MAAKKRKSTVKIPIDRATFSVPHWTDSEPDTVERIQAELAAGYDPERAKNSGYYWCRTEEQWEACLRQRLSQQNFDWREPWEFIDTFQITGYGRGRSAAYLTLESTTTPMKCVMMMSDMSNLITTAKIDKGLVSGRWIFGKRGANYGIQYLGDK